jgi:serine O-acetyltransferase
MSVESSCAEPGLAKEKAAQQRYSLKLLVEQLKEDRRAHQCDSTLPGFRALAVHRFGRWADTVQPRLLRRILSRFYVCCYRFIRNHYGIELPRTTKVGRRVNIGHQGGIVVHPASEIGDDCILRQNATIGAASVETVNRGPILGNRVELGCGAVVLGGVIVGDDVRIGPNAVVTTNVPPGSTVVAEPPRIVHLRNRGGSPPAKAPQ